MMSQWEASQDGYLLGWTIFGPNTTDYPGFFVARPWIVGQGRPNWPFTLTPTDPELKGRLAHSFIGCVCKTLLEARKCIGPEFTCAHRSLSDNPNIVESWI